MKNLLFSLTLALSLAPFFVNAQTEDNRMTQEEVLEHFGSSAESIEQEQTGTANTNTGNTTGNYDLNNLWNDQAPTLTPEQEFMRMREGETADQYRHRIEVENLRRRSAGEGLLPDPTISTTQIPQNNGVISTPLEGNAPPPERDNNEAINITASEWDILDRVAPSSLFGGQEDLSLLLNQVFYAGLAVAVVLAVVMIVRGGVQYMTIDAATSKDSGKKRIQAALGGLVLAFSAVLILSTVNPNIVKLNLTFEKLTLPDSINVDPINITPGTRPGDGGDGGDEVADPGNGTNTNGPIPTSYFGGPKDVRISSDGYALQYCNNTYGGRVGSQVETTTVSGTTYRWCYALDNSGNKIPFPQGSKSAHGGYFETAAVSGQRFYQMSGDYIAYPLSGSAAAQLTGLPSRSTSQLRGKSVRLTLSNGTVITASIADRGPHSGLRKLDVSPALSQKISAGGGLRSVVLVE